MDRGYPPDNYHSDNYGRIDNYPRTIVLSPRTSVPPVTIILQDNYPQVTITPVSNSLPDKSTPVKQIDKWYPRANYQS